MQLGLSSIPRTLFHLLSDPVSNNVHSITSYIAQVVSYEEIIIPHTCIRDVLGTGRLLMRDLSDSIQSKCDFPNKDNAGSFPFASQTSKRQALLLWFDLTTALKLCQRLIMAETLLSPARLLYVIMFILPPTGTFRHSSYLILCHTYHEKIICSCQIRVKAAS